MRNKLTYFFILLGLTITLKSCSSDDSSSSSKTFLEKYDGTVWDMSDNYGYLMLHNSLTNTTEYWHPDGLCYEHWLETFNSIEDVGNKLILTYQNTEYITILTMSIQGDILKIIDEGNYYGDGESWYQVGYLEKATVNINNLTICN